MNKKIGRNAPCPCGSRLKYKRCCEEKDLLGSMDLSTAQATLEMALSDMVYGSVLVGVWSAFHPHGEEPPEIEALEDFYHSIYGCDLDRDHLDDLVVPLPKEIFADLAQRLGTHAPVIDIAAEMEATSPMNPQAELFPSPDSASPPSLRPE